MVNKISGKIITSLQPAKLIQVNRGKGPVNGRIGRLSIEHRAFPFPTPLPLNGPEFMDD
jgi:hypothetical protein